MWLDCGKRVIRKILNAGSLASYAPYHGPELSNHGIKWLGADEATSHYLNQWWLVYWCIYASLGITQWVNEPIETNISIIYNISTLMVQIIVIPPHGRQRPTAIHSPYCGCLSPSDARSQDISHHGIDLILWECFSLTTTRANSTCYMW